MFKKSGKKSAQKGARAKQSRKWGFETLEPRVVLSAETLPELIQPVEVESENVTVQAASSLAPSTDLSSVPFWEFYTLTPAELAQLTPEQISTINNSSVMQAWTTEQRAALTKQQVPYLSIPDVSISLLTHKQIGWLTTSQVRSVKFHDLHHLHVDQISLLTSEQIGSLKSSAFDLWSAQQRLALGESQVKALPIGELRIDGLTNQQIGWLKASQIRKLPFWQFEYLHTNQIPYLTDTQIESMQNNSILESWSSSQRASLTYSQIQSLSLPQINPTLLTSQQIGWLTTNQIRTINHYHLNSLHNDQIPSLSISQIASLTNSTLSLWTHSQRAALSTPQVRSLSVPDINIDLLPYEQVGYLSQEQIHALPYYRFRFLQASQIPLLTTSQIASIPDSGILKAWSNQRRASLTLQQVQALQIPEVSIELLNEEQRSWLKVSQIRSLEHHHFSFLLPSQIQYLTNSQIASVPNTGVFTDSWSADQRNALTVSQIRAIDTSQIRIDWLNDQQILSLSSKQIRSLPWQQWTYLNSEQISELTKEQLATIETIGQLNHLGDAFHVELSREQLFALQPQVLAYFTHVRDNSPAPMDYVPVENIGKAADGLANDARTLMEYNNILGLVPYSEATHIATQSGNWANAATWSNGVIPDAGARVIIPEGITVRFNTEMKEAIFTLRIDGTLNFANRRDTLLKVDTIIVNTMGALYIGMENNPIASNATAKIVFPDSTRIDLDWDPLMLSRGIVSRGQVRMFGQDVTPQVELLEDPRAGDRVLYLSEVPTNWKPGDRIVITGTNTNNVLYRSEERVIRAIFGRSVLVDPLQYDHLTPEGHDLHVHVANMERNIVLTGEGTNRVEQRPHTMFVHNPDIEIENIAVYGFGRTDKTERIGTSVYRNGQEVAFNSRGRYAVHFHRTGVDPSIDPVEVRGSVIWGSPGWGLVNHQSHVIMEDNVAYQVVGSSFVTEDGNEIGAMRRNLSIDSTGSEDDITARTDIHDFGHGGHGFWLQGPGVELVDNVSSGSRGAAFSIFTASTRTMFDAVNMDDPSLAAGHQAIPLGSVPQTTFRGNTAYASRSGVEFWMHNMAMNDGQTVVEDFVSWNSRLAGIDLHHTAHVTFKDVTIIGNEKYAGYGVFTNRYVHDIVFDNIHIEGVETGIEVPLRRSTEIIGGYISAVNAIYLEAAQDTIRSVKFKGLPQVPLLSESQLNGREQKHFLVPTTVNLEHRDFDVLTAYDDITVDLTYGLSTPVKNEMRIYFPTHAPDYVPFKSSEAAGLVPTEYLNLTNRQLQNRYGISFGGKQIPGSAIWTDPAGPAFAMVSSSPSSSPIRVSSLRASW